MTGRMYFVLPTETGFAVAYFAPSRREHVALMDCRNEAQALDIARIRNDAYEFRQLALVKETQARLDRRPVRCLLPGLLAA